MNIFHDDGISPAMYDNVLSLFQGKKGKGKKNRLNSKQKHENSKDVKNGLQ